MKNYSPENLSFYLGGREIYGYVAESDIIVERHDPPLGSLNPSLRGEVSEVSEVFEVRYCVIGAGPVGHPQKIFTKVARHQGWTILKATPHPVGDCWIFEVEAKSKGGSYLPSYISII